MKRSQYDSEACLERGYKVKRIVRMYIIGIHHRCRQIVEDQLRRIACISECGVHILLCALAFLVTRPLTTGHDAHGTPPSHFLKDFFATSDVTF
jgi:hypothetical protein